MVLREGSPGRRLDGRGSAVYRAEYELDKNQVTLRNLKGSRREVPTLGYLPKFPGLRICVEGPAGIAVVRARG